MRLMRLSWPSLPARTVSAVLAGHSAVALALGALIYLVCLTGVLCVFIDELQLWEQPTPAPVAFDPARSDALVAQVLREVGGPSHAPVIFLRAPTTPDERVILSVGARQWTPTRDGRLQTLELPCTNFLAELHYTLSLPAPWGELLVGGLGAGLVSLLLSGVLAHPRILRDAFVLRLQGSRRLQEADLHNRLGVWGLPFHLAVSLTGAIFGLASLLYLLTAAIGFHGDTGRAQGVLNALPPPSADTRPAPIPPLARAIAYARAQRPGSNLYYLGLSAPGTRGARLDVQVTAPGRLPRGESFSFDARGRPVGGLRYASGDPGLQLYAAAAQVHFGFFGGWPVRLAYGLLGWTLCWVCAGGTTIWLTRRRDQGRPAPRLERAWSACVWGAPAALALAALQTPLQGAPAFWLTLAALLAMSQSPPSTRRSEAEIDRLYRLILACSLAALVLTRLPTSLHSPAALAVDATLAVFTVGFGTGGRIRRLHQG